MSDAPQILDPGTRQTGRRFARDAAGENAFLHKLLITLAVGALVALVWALSSLLLTLFAAVMFAVILSLASTALHMRLGMRRGVALTLVVLLITAVTIVILALFGTRIVVQGTELAQTIPTGVRRLRDALSGNTLGQHLIDEASNVNMASAGSSLLSRAFGAVTTLLGTVTDILLIFFAGLYLAAQPDLYVRGMLSLVPARRRSRAAEIMRACYEALGHWVLGQLISMVVVGVLFGVALSIIGVPSSIVLGLIAALSEFIPLVGPVLATIPAMLEALTVDLSSVAWVVVAFLIIQQLESNLLVPYVQRRAVHLPPVVALFATVMFGLLFGVPGLLFAVPLVVVVMVLVRMIYVEDILGGEEPEDDPNLRSLVAVKAGDIVTSVGS